MKTFNLKFHMQFPHLTQQWTSDKIVSQTPAQHYVRIIMIIYQLNFFQIFDEYSNQISFYIIFFH